MFTTWLNNNQGVVAALGLLVVIPFSILSERVLSYIRSKRRQKELQQILLKELFYNLFYVSHAEDSYQNQMKDPDNLHIPKLVPRTKIIEKFFEPDYLFSLDDPKKKKMIEVFAQLQSFKSEFLDWRRYLSTHPNMVKDSEIYQEISSPMKLYIRPLMENMINLWVQIVKEIGSKSDQEQISQLNNKLDKKIKQGNEIFPTYKTSLLINELDVNQLDYEVIICWRNDADIEIDKEVIEIEETLSTGENLIFW